MRNEHDTLVYEDKDKANILNSFFATVGNKLASKFTPASGSPLSFIHRITPTIDDIPLQDKQFLHKLQNVNIRKAHGPDNITSREMKMVHSEFSHCIANISRMSLRETTYPSKWKVGKVTTLFKSGERDVCANYRPLTLLSIPSKITESVICEALDPHLRCVLQRNQWGLQKGFII